MSEGVRYREFDWFLFGLVVLISTLGILEIYSTTQNQPRFATMYLRQLAWVGVGLVVMFLVSRIDYQIGRAHV